MNISIKNPPDQLVERLNRRAAQHNRTPEEEALLILEAALGPNAAATGPAAVLQELRRLGLSTPSESARIIRDDRDR